MTKGYILVLPSHRRELFNNHIEEYGYFAEPVPVFSHNRNYPYLVLLMVEEGLITHLGSGRGFTFQNVGRHITNTDFTILVKHSWIGTTPVQSKILEKLITEIPGSGKSLVYAVKRDTKVYNRHFQRYTENDISDEDIPF